MRNLWVWRRNKIVRDDAYLSMSTHLGDDLGSEPIFAALREFSSAPDKPIAVPVLLLEAFNASQKRVSRQRKVRAGTGALFGVAVLIPSLAYAGVLPSPVSRIVQHVFNVISLPIQIPSIATPSPSPTKSTSDGTDSVPSSSSSTDESPNGEQNQSPNEIATNKGSTDSSPETNPTSDSESSSVPLPGDGELGTPSLIPPLDSNLSGSGDVEVQGLPALSGLTDGTDGSQPQLSQPSSGSGSGETAQVEGN